MKVIRSQITVIFTPSRKNKTSCDEIFKLIFLSLFEYNEFAILINNLIFFLPPESEKKVEPVEKESFSFCRVRVEK